MTGFSLRVKGADMNVEAKKDLNENSSSNTLDLNGIISRCPSVYLSSVPKAAPHIWLTSDTKQLGAFC